MPRKDEEPVVDLLEADRGSEAVGSATDQEDVRPMLHQPPREADRRARSLEPGDGPGLPPGAVHDRRIQFDFALLGQHASAPGVEAYVLLEQTRRRLDRIHGASAIRQDRRAGVQRRAEAGASAGFMRGVVVRDSL
jgi:hypothetical protein